MDRIFLDANVLFSAAYRRDAGLARLWQLERAELVTSAYAAEEARLNLTEEGQRLRLAKHLENVRMITSVAPLPSGVKLPEKDQPVSKRPSTPGPRACSLAISNISARISGAGSVVFWFLLRRSISSIRGREKDHERRPCHGFRNSRDMVHDLPRATLGFYSRRIANFVATYPMPHTRAQSREQVPAVIVPPGDFRALMTAGTLTPVPAKSLPSREDASRKAISPRGLGDPRNFG